MCEIAHLIGDARIVGPSHVESSWCWPRVPDASESLASGAIRGSAAGRAVLGVGELGPGA